MLIADLPASFLFVVERNRMDHKCSAQCVDAKLDVIIRLLALLLSATKRTTSDKALLLEKAGLSFREIAQLCDSDSDLIKKIISRARAGGKR